MNNEETCLHALLRAPAQNNTSVNTETLAHNLHDLVSKVIPRISD
jgi:hypothetical protein